MTIGLHMWFIYDLFTTIMRHFVNFFQDFLLLQVFHSNSQDEFDRLSIHDYSHTDSIHYSIRINLKERFFVQNNKLQ